MEAGLWLGGVARSVRLVGKLRRGWSDDVGHEIGETHMGPKHPHPRMVRSSANLRPVHISDDELPNGRVLEEPAKGAKTEDVYEAETGKFDDWEAAELEQLRDAISEGIKDVERGDVVDGFEFLKELRSRHEDRLR